MTRILHIETSTKMCSVALSENGNLIAHKNIEAEGFVHSEKLNLLIEEVCKDSKVAYEKLSAISVSGGPGSYTGLRIGVSTAKGLCYALNLPLVAIDSLECLAQWGKINFPDFNGLFCAMIDARRMEVFSAIYNSNLQQLKPISADIVDEESYSEFANENKILLLGDGAPKLMELWQDRGEFIFSNLIADARGQVNRAYELFCENSFVDTAYYEPFYLKDFIAGIKKG